MDKPSVFVTRRWPEIAEKELKKYFNVTLNHGDKALSNKELKDAFYNHDALAPTVSDTIDENIIKSGKSGKGKIISNYGVGFSHIDLEACQKYKIKVTNTPNVLTDATADLTILLMLMVSRRSKEGEYQINNNLWPGWSPTHLLGSELTNKTLGIIGLGRIGQAVAKRAYFGFNMKIKFFNRSKKNINFSFKAEQVDNIYDLCKSSDFLTIHCPGGNKNKHLIDQDVLDAMKKTAFLINTARGDIICENSLFEALKNNSIAGAGLDVFENEPEINPKFLKAQNLTMLPHLGSATKETRNAMGLKVIDNLRKFFDTGDVIDPVPLVK
tara:strand:- start:137 stop:1114 length:978 start_codon:yes stop_codon:yes gene_type:complete